MYSQRGQPTVANANKKLQSLAVSKQAPTTNRQSHKINLLANYFQIGLGENRSLFQYAIEVTPASIRPRLRRRAIYCWLRTHPLTVKYATNYHNFLVTSTKIPDQEDLQDFKFWDDYETAPRAEHAPSCRLTIRYIRVIDVLSFLTELASNSTADPAQKGDMLILMDMIFSQRPNEKSFGLPTQLPRVGVAGPNRFFQLTTPSPTDFLGGGNNHSQALLVAQMGFVRHTRSSARLLLNISTTTGAFYRPGPLRTLIDNFIGRSNNWPRTDLSNFLKGLRVRTKHLMASNHRPEKIYTISRVAPPLPPFQNQRPTPARIFFNFNGINTSVGTYYAQNHRLTGVNNTSDFIVVQCGPDDHPIYLPSTVLDVVPGQPFKKPLSSEQLADFITHSCRVPAENRDSITGSGMDLFGIRNTAPDGPNARFGISVTQQMVKVQGSILSPPTVRYGGNGRVPEELLSKGGWNLISKSFVRAAPASSWTFLQVCFRGDERIKDKNLEWNATQLQEAMPAYGIKGHSMVQTGPKSHTLELRGGRNSSDPAIDQNNENALRDKLKYFRNHEKEIKLVLITLPAKNTKLYAMIKRVADVHVGIHTICAVTGWQRADGMDFWGIKHSAQFLGNLLLKYNLKLGGINHRLDDQKGLLSKSTMFVGMDVTHPTPNSQNGAPSIAAVVATEEPEYFVHWPVSLRLQTPKEDKMARELIDDVQAMFRERLEHWKSKNDGQLPEQIIIYRDGVSDEFYKLLKEKEIPRMKQAAAEAALPSQGYDPCIVYIVVLKRHSTRFFPSPEKDVTDRTHLDRNGNSKPGLLVTDTLTRRPGSNFFLQSHESLKGTARPTHYLIKINGSCHDEPAVMAMTHDFCYLFSRATRSVHIHPAVFYADLACDRARHYLRQVYQPSAPGANYNQADWLPNSLYKPHSTIQNSMFYI